MFKVNLFVTMFKITQSIKVFYLYFFFFVEATVNSAIIYLGYTFLVIDMKKGNLMKIIL